MPPVLAGQTAAAAAAAAAAALGVSREVTSILKQQLEKACVLCMHTRALNKPLLSCGQRDGCCTVTRRRMLVVVMCQQFCTQPLLLLHIWQPQAQQLQQAFRPPPHPHPLPHTPVPFAAGSSMADDSDGVGSVPAGCSAKSGLTRNVRVPSWSSPPRSAKPNPGTKTKPLQGSECRCMMQSVMQIVLG
jgi:hypothetical protein